MLRKLEEADGSRLYLLLSADSEKRRIDLPLTSPSAFDKWISEILAAECLGLCTVKVVIDEWSGRPAGMILLNQLDAENKIGEMGTWLGPPYRGKGLNAKAKEAMLNTAFHELGYKSVLLFTARDNTASVKSLQKLPYVKPAGDGPYTALKKHREFLFQKAMEVYEITQADFLQYVEQRKRPSSE